MTDHATRHPIPSVVAHRWQVLALGVGVVAGLVAGLAIPVAGAR